MKCLVMVAYPKVDSDSYSFRSNVYVKPKGSKIFVDLQNNYGLLSESIASIYINNHKYDYAWYNVMLNPGDLIKLEIIKTFKNKDGVKTKREIRYYLIGKNSKFVDENPFPMITGDVYELNGDYKKLGVVENVVRAKTNKLQR